MAEIYKTIEIEYNDKTYKIKPDFDFINYLDQQEIDLIDSVTQFINRKPQLVNCINIIKSALNYAGEDVTGHDIVESFGTYNGKAIILATQIVMACDYNPVTEDMAEGQQKSKKKAKAKL